ncbi:MAG TPA: hypothetical protein VNA57_08555 [Acidimicrobiales bacterium]|nr:hypothetical protein [Acidimicrobiales bacterium]
MAHLEAAGVGEATLSSLRNEKAVQAAPTPRVVVSLRLYPEPPRIEHYHCSKATLPQAWLEEAPGLRRRGSGGLGPPHGGHRADG